MCADKKRTNHFYNRYYGCKSSSSELRALQSVNSPRRKSADHLAKQEAEI